MLQRFLCIAVLFFSSQGALAALTMPAKLTYESKMEDSQEVDLSSWDQKLKEMGYASLQVRGEIFPVLKIDWLHRLYLNEKTGGILMIKSQLHLSESVKEGQPYYSNEGTFVHLSSATKGLHHMLFFAGIKDDEITAIAKKLSSIKVSETTRSSSKFSAVGLFVRKAQAAQGCFGQLESASYKPTSESSSLLKSSWECIKGAGGGVWSATGGGVISAVKGVGKLVTSPIETAGAMKNEFKKLAAMASNISNSINSIADGFSALPLEVKSKVICNLSATVGTSVALMILSGGSGVSVATSAVLEAVKKALSAFPTVVALQKYSQKLGQVAAAIQDSKAVAAWNEAAKAWASANQKSQKLFIEERALPSRHPRRSELAKEMDAARTELTRRQVEMDALKPAADEALKAQEAMGKISAGVRLTILGNTACQTTAQLLQNKAEYGEFTNQGTKMLLPEHQPVAPATATK